DGAGSRSLASLPVFARHDPSAGRQVRPLSTNSVRRVIEDLARAAGLGDLVVTPHRFRAWFATHLVEQTGDLAAVQDLLGHESANTTRIYTKVAAGRLRAIHARAFGAP
ncbi:MAG TPA: tyrosine-type recombinase/integrase, partial [Dehalococcoidia bacterium]|nr:tyrosine-type recombinase/integrase [Dehalococcoidia bacterium]